MIDIKGSDFNRDEEPMGPTSTSFLETRLNGTGAKCFLQLILCTRHSVTRSETGRYLIYSKIIEFLVAGKMLRIGGG